jgi:hypothetical protein
MARRKNRLGKLLHWPTADNLSDRAQLSTHRNLFGEQYSASA